MRAVRALKKALINGEEAAAATAAVTGKTNAAGTHDSVGVNTVIRGGSDGEAIAEIDISNEGNPSDILPPKIWGSKFIRLRRTLKASQQPRHAAADPCCCVCFSHEPAGLARLLSERVSPACSASVPHLLAQRLTWPAPSFASSLLLRFCRSQRTARRATRWRPSLTAKRHAAFILSTTKASVSKCPRARRVTAAESHGGRGCDLVFSTPSHCPQVPRRLGPAFALLAFISFPFTHSAYPCSFMCFSLRHHDCRRRHGSWPSWASASTSTRTTL